MVLSPTYATLTPLPSSSSTRVTLSRSLPNASPGSHAFLYMPSLAAFQSHPFTMVGREPVEFVVAARQGFTKKLFDMACEKPGRRFRAGIDGGYGAGPGMAVEQFEKVVLFAGGSGATFAFALACEWAKKFGGDMEGRGGLEVVWSVRNEGKSSRSLPSSRHDIWTEHLLTTSNQTGNLAGFKRELAILRNHPRVLVRVHVTKKPIPTLEPPSEIGSQNPPALTFTTLEEKLATQVQTNAIEVRSPPSTPLAVTTLDDKLPGSMHTKALPALETNLCISSGRPDIYATLARTSDECSTNDRILVGVCGPTGLTDGVKDAVTRCERAGGPGFVLHAEAFGW